MIARLSRLALAVVLVLGLAVPGPCSGQAAGQAVPPTPPAENETVKGAFRKPGRVEAFTLSFAQPAVGEDAVEAALLDPSGQPVIVLEALSEIDYLGRCRSKETGLDHLVFRLSAGAPSDPGALTFVFFDPDTGRFSRHDRESSADLETMVRFVACPGVSTIRLETDDAAWRQYRDLFLAGRCNCVWEKRVDNEATAWALFEELTPAAEPTLIQDPGTGQLRPNLPVRKMSQAKTEAVLDKMTALDDDRLIVQTIDSDRRWEIVAVTFEETMSSFGLLLAKDKQAKTYKAFYNIPPGDSKVSLFTPEAELKPGDKLVARLCTDCSWWGEFGTFIIDLNTMTLTPQPQ